MLKKSFVVAIFLALIVTPFSSVSAYDVLTKPNDSRDYFEFLEPELDKWCKDIPNDLRKQKEDPGFSYSTKKRNARLAELDKQLSDAQAECRNLESKLKNSETNSLKCGTGFVRIGSDCVSHTKNCQIQFGKNVTGSYNGDQITSQCTCDAGYSFSDNMCVANTANEPTSEDALRAQLIALIQKLQAQLAAMIASGNY